MVGTLITPRAKMDSQMLLRWPGTQNQGSKAMNEPEPEKRMIDCAPARVVLERVEMTLQWYLPPSQRERFLRLGDDYSYLDSHRWETAYNMAIAKLRPCLEVMKGWMDRPETDDLLASWDDDVLFFYVLRFQFMLVRLYSMGEEMVPYEWDEFWNWSMVPLPQENWIFYTFPTVVEFNKMETKPPIWKFFSPSDVPITKEG